MKTSALIAVAASCGLLAAAGAGVASWAVLTAGEAATSAASAAGGDDGVFVGDELNALLLTDAQVATLGINATVGEVSADYGVAPFEAPPPCSILIGQTPMRPAGVRSIEMGAQGGVLFRQQVVQFPTAEDADAEFASVLEGSSECGSFVDDLGSTWTWTAVSATERPAVVAGYAAFNGTTDRVIVVGRTANAISYAFASTDASSLSAEQLAQAVAEATAERLAP